AKLPLDGLTPDQQNALIQKTVDIINNVSSNSSSVESAKGEVDALKSELPNPGSTYDLTEGNDNLKGTDLDDTFNGTTYVGNGTNKSTLSAFDKIDGGAGRDTLNAQVLANNSASDAKLKSEDLVKALAGVTNVESVNIVTDLPNEAAIALNSGSTGMANLALDVLGSKLVGLTTDISGKLNIKANGSVDALTAASAKSVNVDAAGAVTLTDTKSATNVNVKASGDVSLTDTEAASSISVDANGAGKVTLTKATNVENLSVKNATNLIIAAGGDKLNTVTLENVTLGDSSSVAAAIDFKGATTLNFNNVKMIDGSDGKIAHIKSSAETLNLNFSGKEATFALVTNQVTKVANINANADSNNFLITTDGTKNPGHVALASDSFTTFVIKGNGKELVFDAGDLDKVTSIDASGFNGNAKIAFGDSNGDAIAGLKVSSGAGNDTLVLESNKLSAGSVIDGGAGRDTIVLKSTALADSATLGMIKNIENATISDELATADVSGTGFQVIGVTKDVTAAGQTLTINKDQTVSFQGAAFAAANEITVKLNDATGTNDVLNLVLDAKTANQDSITIGAADKALIIENVETININSIAKDATTGADATANTIYLQAKNATKIAISGDDLVELKALTASKATDYSKVMQIDASESTAGIKFDTNEITIANGATIKGGSGADSITLKGNSLLITGGEGADTFTVKKGSTKTNYDTITDFKVGDKLVIDSTDFVALTTDKFTKIEAGANANLDSLIKQASTASDTNPHVSYFHFNGDTYIVADKDGSTTPTFSDANDTIIKLSGIHNLTVDNGSIVEAQA
ncbi:beta strand repeat-containing protein, partial [Campylobacter fetus]|uniref:beta strand repeat-containing protein n=1 Tax=Campylobacter fetus TaxID=196 RepID=UPI00163C206C